VSNRVPILRTSERRSFKRCPQQWAWAWRQGLRPNGFTANALWFGSGIHLALAERYEFAEDAKSATFWLRPGIKFHNGAPVTPEDVKWSYEHYHGAWAKVLQDRTDGVEILDDRAIRFIFKGPFLDFPRLIGTANVSGAGWVVPAKYYQEVGPDGFAQKPIGAGPYRLVTQEPGTRLTTALFTSSGSRSSACRKRRPVSRCSSAAKRTSCISCRES